MSKDLESFAKKLNTDKNFFDKIIKNYEFAKKELLDFGISLDKESYYEMVIGYRLMMQGVNHSFSPKDGESLNIKGETNVRVYIE